jgi:TRAP-type C4-dicarboxylate transport system permease small subunit
MRNLTGRGIVWVWAWTSVLFVWSVFFAFHVLYRQRLDVTVDFVIERVSGVWRRVLGVLVCVCGLAFTGVILLQAPAILKRQVGVLDFVGLDRYWLSLPLVWASFFVLVEFIVALRRPEAQFERDAAAEVPKWSL